MKKQKSLIGLLSTSFFCLLFLMCTSSTTTDTNTTEKPPFVSVSLDRMKVLYRGIDNPLSVAMSGVSNKDITLSSPDLGIEKINNGQYIIRATEKGNGHIVVEAPNVPKQIFSFRVKGIPDPTARLGNQDSGEIASGTFKAQAGIGAWIDNFDVDARCRVNSFDITWVSQDKDPITFTNTGARFQQEAGVLMDKAKVGDRYFFDQIKCKCPGDKEVRIINSLVFSIK